MTAAPIDDYYDALGIDPSADARTVKDAFHHLALEVHPDHSADPGAEKQFERIAEAYDVLADPRRRAEYDWRRLRATAAQPSLARPGIDEVTRGNVATIEVGISISQVMTGSKRRVRC